MDKKLVGLISVFLLVFGVFMTYLVFSQSEPFNIRAVPPGIVSCPNSFSFTNKLDLTVGSSSTIIAYVRNAESSGLPRIPVTCQTTLGTIEPSSGVTGNSGNTTFTLTSITPGLATVTCSTPSCGAFAKSVSIQFSN